MAFSVGVSYGADRAYGNFTKMDFNNQNAGFADIVGKRLTIHLVNYADNPLAGFGLIGSFCKHTISEIAKATLAEGYLKDFNASYCYLTINGSYKTSSIYAGPFLNIPLTRNRVFWLHIKTGFGITAAKTPQIAVEIGSPYSVSFLQSSASSATFGFTSGIYFFAKLPVNLSLAIDYYYARPNFHFDSSGYPLAVSSRYLSGYNQIMSSICYSIGLTYQLYRK